mgnify:CR=1 FL=1
MKKAPNSAVLTGDEVRAAAVEIKKKVGESTRLLLSIGLAVAAESVDTPTAVNAFTRAGFGNDSAKVYVSNANRFAKHATRQAFKTQLKNGIGINDAYNWLGAIEKAETAGEKAPTFDQFKKAKKAEKKAENAKKNETQSRKRSGQPDQKPDEDKTPTAGEIVKRHAHEVTSASFKSKETREQFLRNYRTLILRSIDEELALIESTKKVSTKK